MNLYKKVKELEERVEKLERTSVVNKLLMNIFENKEVSVEPPIIIPHTKLVEKFTEDEKTILRNLPNKYRYITRGKDGDDIGNIVIFEFRPYKTYTNWCNSPYETESIYFNAFNHIFKSIKWEDEEPCNFRDYL